MVDTYRLFVDSVRKKFHVIELRESPLLRQDKSYFTFSPFQDTQKNFSNLKESTSLYIKKQQTIRKLDSLNLTNPLNMNYQVTYAIQNYSIQNQLPVIVSLIEIIRTVFFNNISQSNIEITYPDTIAGFFDDLTQDYKLNMVPMSERYFSNLGLKGDHYYIKVRMAHREGSINVVDFVLVDFQKNFESQLDSIWVEDLIDLLHENVSFIFDEKKYKDIKQIVSKYTTIPRDQHTILNDLRVTFKMMDLGVYPAAKGINSEIRRKIRKLYFYYFYYVDKDTTGLIRVVYLFGKEINATDYDINIFINELKNIENNYKSSVKRVQSKKIPREIAQSSYGIPNEYYGHFLTNWHSEYDF
ncbi:MAG: hypothetical protein N4Q58_02090 [Lactobacillus iners]|nr:hypothetical protein [Lactobacillus iners]MCT7813867.1 hypothetical protein [Lactobacillus iners]MCT7830093.1 hypothetical protein [Lactobacillus iners]MCT7844168.1 hypothetical protein [Lactobacillus iners]